MGGLISTTSNGQQKGGRKKVLPGREDWDLKERKNVEGGGAEFATLMSY